MTSWSSAGTALHNTVKDTCPMDSSHRNFWCMQAPKEAANSLVQQANEATSKAVQSAQDASGNLLDGINQAVPGLQSSVDSAAASFSSQVGSSAQCVAMRISSHKASTVSDLVLSTCVSPCLQDGGPAYMSMLVAQMKSKTLCGRHFMPSSFSHMLCCTT